MDGTDNTYQSKQHSGGQRWESYISALTATVKGVDAMKYVQNKHLNFQC